MILTPLLPKENIYRYPPWSPSRLRGEEIPRKLLFGRSGVEKIHGILTNEIKQTSQLGIACLFSVSIIVGEVTRFATRNLVVVCYILHKGREITKIECGIKGHHLKFAAAIYHTVITKMILRFDVFGAKGGSMTG